MLPGKTTFVLGSGFSYELGLPLGIELKDRIAAILGNALGSDPREVIHRALHRGQRDEDVTVACRSLRAALPLALSIDNLVEHRGKDATFTHCAKVGIAAAILDAEAESCLKNRAQSSFSPDITQASASALFALFQLLTAQSNEDNVERAFSNVAFINFNYDRCLEHFLVNALVDYTGLSTSLASEAVDRINIWHPYGTVGRLPWSSRDPNAKAVAFGENQRVDVAAVSQSIKTYSEEVAETEELSSMRGWLRDSALVVFLGFAFHPQNVRLLTTLESRQSGQLVGTCYKVPPPDPSKLVTPDVREFAAPDAEAFKRAVSPWYENFFRPHANIVFEPLTCRQLVDKYQNSWRG